MAQQSENKLILGTELTPTYFADGVHIDVRLPIYVIKLIMIRGSMEELRDSIIPVDDVRARKPHSILMRLTITTSKDTVQPFIKLPDGTFKAVSEPLPRSRFDELARRFTVFHETMRKELSIERYKGTLGYDRCGFLMDAMSVTSAGRVEFTLGFQRNVPEVGSDFTVKGSFDLSDVMSGKKSAQEAVGEMDVYQPGASKPDKDKVTWKHLANIVGSYRTMVESIMQLTGKAGMKEGKFILRANIPLG